MTYPLAGKRVWVAGHRGMVGGALVRQLEAENCTVLTVGRDGLDLRDGRAVQTWMSANRPQAVILAAAKVGGIVANDSWPADFLFDNLAIENAIIHGAFETGVEKLLFLGSSCIYPKFAPQPIREDALLTGPLEPTNEWYAVAKIAGIKLGQAYRRQHGCDYISVMPTNLYGIGDNFDRLQSHVVPALILKAHEAKLSHAPHIEVWGTGQARRELLYVDDAADGMVFLMKNYSDEGIVNIGTGQDVPIADLARLVCEAVGYQGTLRFDTSRPDGTPRKVVDVGRINAMGWTARTSLKDGLALTYRWFLENVAAEKRRVA